MELRPTIRKLRADSPEAGTYGQDIAGGRKYVYAAYDGKRRIVVCASAGEARRRYCEARDREWHEANTRRN